jgi:membrane-associated phospholipid phosphatase
MSCSRPKSLAAFALVLLSAINFGVQAQVVAKPDHFGDAMQFILPATAAAISIGKEDTDGLKQFAYSALLSQGSTAILKNAVDSRRPNGTGQGFPSGHTSIAFASASFVHFRYGVGTALPLYVLAGLTAYSRVATHHHFTKDVIGGALIGTGSAYLLTHPLDKHTSVTLVPEFGGAQFSLNRTW